MSRILVSRFAFVLLLIMTTCLRVNAQTPSVVTPTIAFNVADGLIVHKSVGLIQVSIAVTDALGLRAATLSGGNSSAQGRFPVGSLSGSVDLYFYVGYYPVGNYTFTATAFNTSGVFAHKSITLHVVP